MKKPKKKTLTQKELVMHEPVEVDLATIEFAPYNPRLISDQAMKALEASIEKHGVVLNLVVQRWSEEYQKHNVLIGGHQRVRAVRKWCKDRGLPPPARAWAVVLDVDDATAKQLNVSLNNVEGEFDAFKLGELFAGIRNMMTVSDIDATGFSPDQLDELQRLTRPPEELAAELERQAEQSVGGFAKSVTLSIEFDTVEQRDEAKTILKAMVADGKIRAGVLLLTLLKSDRALKGKRRNERRSVHPQSD